MSRGRPPAKTDAAAVDALAEIKEFIKNNSLTNHQLARLAGVSPSTVARVLEREPPTWTESFKVIANYVKYQKTENSGLAELARTLHGNKDAAHAAAALLRAVATLLERP